MTLNIRRLVALLLCSALPLPEQSPDHQQYVAKEEERSLRRSADLQELLLRQDDLNYKLAAEQVPPCPTPPRPCPSSPAKPDPVTCV